jgi:PTH2 family peptidyl-tRNA hydrolase
MVNHYPVKQVIIFNASLRDAKGYKLPKGKIAAQVAHASMKVFFDSMQQELNTVCPISETGTHYLCFFTEDMKYWMANDFAKTVLKCDSEEQLDALYRKAVEANLPCSVIVDNGTTCFDGKKTKTCIAIGPVRSDVVDQITGHLSLLT